LILTRLGRDAEVARGLLGQAGFTGRICADLSNLSIEIEAGAGLAVIAEEAVGDADIRPLADVLSAQPAWSDFPFILLTHHGGGLERNPKAARLSGILGNVTFLERPFHPTTLLSLVRTAIRGRRRQYDARARLIELEKERLALAALTSNLEDRVNARTAELFAEVAAREKAQAQLLQSQKVESLGQLTGGVAHDFNNLLMAVMGNLDLLRKRHAQDERSMRLLDAALQGARRGAALTQRMLSFARQQELKTSAVDLGAMITGMRSLIEQAISPAIELKIDVEPGLPLAKADANQLELAVLNLCINARDAMTKGGSITITVDQARPEKGQSKRFLKLSVVDTGEGMNEETLKKAIEPFFSTKPVGKGTGLGLSSVHGLATQLGGKFELRSALGKGTTALLLLPEADEDHQQPDRINPAQEAMRAVPKETTILVVDDDTLIAMSTADMLEDLGYTVIEANSAKAALEIIDTGRPVDLLMTDHAMPGMTGLELADIVRRKRPELPILLATGYAELPEGSTLQLPRLSKPYQQFQLDAQINRLLSQSR